MLKSTVAVKPEVKRGGSQPGIQHRACGLIVMPTPHWARRDTQTGHCILPRGPSCSFVKQN